MTGADEHVAELAELYALGALETDERQFVDVHAVACATCARALGRAEAVVAALDDLTVPRLEPPERLGARIAASAAASVVTPFAPRAARRPSLFLNARMQTAAAALALAVGLGGFVFHQDAELRTAASRQDEVLATIATSHFRHSTFVPRQPNAPVAKVLYPADGSWLYVILDTRDCGCRVVAHSSTGTLDLGYPEKGATTATLFTRKAGKPTQLQLVRGTDEVTSTATLVY